MKKILVVVDMQNDFIDGSLGTKEAVEIVPAVIAEIGKDYDTVIATMDTHPENYLETNEGKHLPVRHCIKGSDGWQIRAEIQSALEAKNATILEKPTFGSYALVDLLKKENPDQVVFVGLCTDICVVSNALMAKAALYEKDICVVENATAGVTEEKKMASLETMRSCQIEIL